MVENLMLDKKDAALVLLAEIAALRRYPNYGEFVLQVPRSMMTRIDLVLDFPDEPGKELGEDT